ncbi:hypothetical protein G9A89_018298 [Geosiphon pyriformis]|nr:hypothetical protein G9A89_018298 [Geosiphon pyriformis]
MSPDLYSMALWPIPQKWAKGETTLKIYPSLKISTNRISNKFIQQTIHSATQRFQSFLANEKFIPPNQQFPAPNSSTKIIQSLIIELVTENIDLSLDVDESYDLWIPNTAPLFLSIRAHLKAKTVYGVLHGLTTFSQLVYQNKLQTDDSLVVPFTPHRIIDYPIYRHRGLLLDTSRNFYPVEDLLRTLDAMSWTKFNVFHWHIVDQHSWPVASEVFPELSGKGAYDPKTMIYTKQDIETIVHYAAQRGIRIIPEFDMPGHTASIAPSHPEIISCHNAQPNWNDFAYEPPSGQLDPTLPETYQFIDSLITEMTSWFPDKVFHGGGDEINLRCWNASAHIREYVAKDSSFNLDSLIQQFVQKQHDIIIRQDKIPMAWQELVIDQSLQLEKQVIIQVWNGEDNVKRVVEAGHKVVTGPARYWYLDCGHGSWLGNNIEGQSWCGNFKTWQWMYTYNPRNGLNEEQKELVIGGEVLLWSEQVDPTNFEPTLWPRAATVAEVLWSGNYDLSGSPRKVTEALPRITELRFRMVSRGIRAEPLQPLWCARTGTCDRL